MRILVAVIILYPTILNSFGIYASSGVSARKATHARQVLGEVPDTYRGRPGWGLGVGLSSPRNNSTVSKNRQR